MLVNRSRSLVRARSSRHVLVALAAALALAAGCEEKSPFNVGISNNNDTGGEAGSGSGGESGSGASNGTAGNGAEGGTSSTGGSGAGGGGVSPQPATFTVSIDKPAVSINLLDKKDLVVSVQPNGYKGSVALSVDDLSGAGVKAELASATVMLDGVTTATTALTLTTVSSSKPGSADFKVSGTVDTGTKIGSSTLTVVSDITIVIPKGVNGLGGTADNPVMDAFGPYPINIAAPAGMSAQNPVTVRFYNADTIPHQIHGGKPDEGFPHDSGDIAPMSMSKLVREVNTPGTYGFYLHDQNAASTIGRIVIQ